MPVERRELGKRTGSFAQGIAVRAGRTVYVSGKVGVDESGKIVGTDDLAAQTRQTFANIQATLSEAGASLSDVVKITTFIVPMERYQEFARVRAEVFGESVPASSTVGVASLVSPEYLIEIEAIAVVD